MPKELNRLIAAEMGQQYPQGANYLVVGFEKLSGPETAQFRRLLRDSRIRFEVVKNSVAARVLEGSGLGAGAKFLQGPCALVTGPTDLPAICKIIVEQSKKLENRISIRGGFMDGAAYERAGIALLASIPPMAVLRSQMAGSLRAPMARVAGAFQSIFRSLACALEGIRKQKEGMSPPPSPQAAASGPVPGGAAA
jgi:large subunit ribosomal protein L10